MAAFLPLIVVRILRLPCWLAMALVVLILCGCSDPLAEENEVLRKEIIEVHDEAMEKIGYMFVLETRLKKFQPTEELSQHSRDLAITALQQANREMFGWMNQYQTLFVDEDLAMDNNYRRQQLELISAVRKMTNEAITGAEQILGAD